MQEVVHHIILLEELVFLVDVIFLTMWNAWRDLGEMNEAVPYVGLSFPIDVLIIQTCAH